MDLAILNMVCKQAAEYFVKGFLLPAERNLFCY